MNIASLFSSAQSVLVLLAGLVTLAEEPGIPGSAKKDNVLSLLGTVLNALPLSAPIKSVAQALAPVAIDLIVAKANQAGLLPKESPPAPAP